jgi:hypothetical protein
MTEVKKNPKQLPPQKLGLSFILDQVDETRQKLTKAIDEDYLPYLMKYQNEKVVSGTESGGTE